MSKETGGKVFPGSGSINDGMCLRDHIAIEAMKAMLIAPIGKFNNKTSEELASDAYMCADDMLEARTR